MAIRRVNNCVYSSKFKIDNSHKMKYSTTRRLSFAFSMLRYIIKFRKLPRIRNPRNINEKIIYLEFFTDPTLPAKLSDKFSVREYVRERGLEHILVPLYGQFDNASEIDFDSLPDSFVVKLNNGYGDVKIIHDKSKYDLENIRDNLNRQIKKKFGVFTGEPHYTLIPPRIIVEKLLPFSNDGLSSSIIDYKFWCFNGKVDFCFVCCDRDNDSHKVNFVYYDIHPWKRRPELMHPKFINDKEIPEPKNLEKMIEYAEILAKGFPCVRIDLYEVEDKIYFGEMTFSSNSGRMRYFTDKALLEMGQKIRIHQ